MYTTLVAMLFPIYVIACLSAIGLSWSKRSFYLSFSYAYLLITFQFFITGRAQELGGNTFLACAFAQAAIGVVAMFTKAPASKSIAFYSAIAILINMIEGIAYGIGHPMREFYFIGINIVQTMQIGSLIFMSPVLFKIYHWIPLKRSLPWQQMTGFGQT